MSTFAVCQHPQLSQYGLLADTSLLLPNRRRITKKALHNLSLAHGQAITHRLHAWVKVLAQLELVRIHYGLSIAESVDDEEDRWTEAIKSCLNSPV